MPSPAPSGPASQDTAPPVIWTLLHALTEPDLYAVTFRRVGKTPEFTIRPLAECTKVKG